MTPFFAKKLSKEDIFEMYRKKDSKALLKALKDNNPEIRLEAVDRLESLIKYEPQFSVREIIEQDIPRKVMPLVDDEDKTVSAKAFCFFSPLSGALQRLSETDQPTAPQYLTRIAQEMKPNESSHISLTRLNCAVAAELAYDNIRRYSCASCGVKWDRQTIDTLFPRHAIIITFHSTQEKGSKQPAGRCPKCGNYYCTQCANMKPPGILCPKCDQNLTWKTATRDEIEDKLRDKFR